jgi:hypothetical protein
VYGGDQRTAGSWPGIRAAINARLEEVSFRTGVMTGAVTLLAVAAAAAAVVLTVTPSHGSAVTSAAGTPAAVSSRAAAAVVPVTTPSPRTSAHSLRKVSPPASSAAAPAAQVTLPSPYPSTSPRSDSAGGSFAAQARGRVAHGGYWPGRWNGASVPRFTGIRNNLTGFSGFSGGLRHFGQGNRPLFPEVFLLVLFYDFVS